MSLGYVRHSQSAISFNVIKKQGETLRQISTKRLREDIEHLTPQIRTSNSSTSTIIQEDNINSKILKETSSQNIIQIDLQ